MIKDHDLLTTMSLMPRNCGFSPGAADSDSTVRDLTWLMESTVAATNHGRPKMEQTTISTATISRSRWYPPPFFSLCSFLKGSFSTSYRVTLSMALLGSVKCIFESCYSGILYLSGLAAAVLPTSHKELSRKHVTKPCRQYSVTVYRCVLSSYSALSTKRNPQNIAGKNKVQVCTWSVLDIQNMSLQS